MKRPRFVRRLAAALSAMLIAGTAAHCPTASASVACGAWPAWEGFRTRFMSEDGRVIDPRLPEKLTVSEAQAYGMVFALIGNDRAGFDKLLEWTRNNLAQGDLEKTLPAWKWGMKPDGGWGVLDPNSASDADVWMAYALIEAGRLWQEPRYDALGERMARNVLKSEVRKLPGLGHTLIPAPFGFDFRDHHRLNHSYLAPQPLRRLAQRQPDAPWPQVLESSRRILLEGSPQGIAPDWVIWKHGQGFEADDEVRRIGSYDAIRVYLWIGLLDAADPDRRALLDHYAPVRKTLNARGVPAERIDSLSGKAEGEGPGGFSASFLPYYAARGDLAAVNAQYLRLIERREAEAGVYYDQALRLFGGGWSDRVYRFAADGSLAPRWVPECRPGPFR